MSKSVRQFIVICIITVISLIVCNLCTPAIYRRLPSDYFRTGIILDTIQDPSLNPTIVVFGDSKGMSVINCNILEEQLVEETVYNFCSPSQTLMESALYYPLLPSSVKVVIQCIQTRGFDGSTLLINEPAYVAFAMENYKVPAEACELLGIEVFNKMNTSVILRNWRCRTVLKSGLSNIMIAKLDDDAPVTRMGDLKYPYPYPSNRSTTYERDVILSEKYVSDDILSFVLNPQVKNSLIKFSDFFSSKGIRYILLITPNNTDFKTAPGSNDSFSRDIDVAFADFECLNYSFFLSPEEFYDLLHPNEFGAERLSRNLADYLK